MTSKKKPILIACDHAGVEFKNRLKSILNEWEWEDLGTDQCETVDYPDYAKEVAERISRGQASRGILICGTGIGMSIAANKIAEVRAALVDNVVVARLSREHNDTNILCLASRVLAPEYASEVARAWLTTEFSGEERHLRRLEKVRQLEKKK